MGEAIKREEKSRDVRVGALWRVVHARRRSHHKVDTIARDVSAVLEYKGLEPREAVDYVIKHRLDQGFAGLITVSSKGEVVCGFNCNGMFTGCATEDGFMEVATWD